jgi:hypothetical protein
VTPRVRALLDLIDIDEWQTRVDYLPTTVEEATSLKVKKRFSFLKKEEKVKPICNGNIGPTVALRRLVHLLFG